MSSIMHTLVIFQVKFVTIPDTLKRIIPHIKDVKLFEMIFDM